MTLILGALDAAEVAAIQSARNDMVRLALAADWESFIQTFDEQAVVMPPNVTPVSGLTQLRAFAEAFPTLTAYQLAAEEIDGRADLAYERGRFDITAGGVPDSGSYLTLWRKQADGSWKILRDIWHSDR